MKVKVSTATGAALNWLVARAEGVVAKVSKTGYLIFVDPTTPCGPQGAQYNPSTNWAQGGPIIEREEIELSPPFTSFDESTGNTTVWGWGAGIHRVASQMGPTPLIAAMRCYVASKLGDEVDVPKELT